MHATLSKDGYTHHTGMDAESFEQLVSGLGKVIHRSAVVIKEESRALVLSAKAIDLHTDHQAARFIAWHCIRQTDQGGTSLLLDIANLFDGLAEAERQHLARMRFMAHRVFEGDHSEHPFLTEVGGQRRFYYAPFLVHDADRADPVLLAFRQRVRSTPPIEVRLNTGDVLVVDNHRMLHGRTAILGSKDRHLERCWIK